MSEQNGHRPTGPGYDGPTRPAGPLPEPPVPAHHNVVRPLTLAVWDAANIDMSLHQIVNDSTVQRPRLARFTQWLCGLPDSTNHDVEAFLFYAIPTERVAELVGFVNSVRAAGMTMFSRDRAEGDIDDAIIGTSRFRVGQRAEPGHLVVVSCDQAMVRAASRPAFDAGWKVTVAGFRESCRWATEDETFAFVDLEDIPGVFTEPLDRFSIYRLPGGGAFGPPDVVLRPVVSLVEQVKAVIDTELTSSGRPLAEFAHEVRSKVELPPSLIHVGDQELVETLLAECPVSVVDEPYGTMVKFNYTLRN